MSGTRCQLTYLFLFNIRIVGKVQVDRDRNIATIQIKTVKKTEKHKNQCKTEGKHDVVYRSPLAVLSNFKKHSFNYLQALPDAESFCICRHCRCILI